MSEEYTIFESFKLPSKGLIYDKPINPTVTLRSMTTAEEMKRLASTQTPYKLMCEIIDSCMVKEKPQISSYDMCIGDYQFLLHKLRIVTYGTEYKMLITCPFCGEVSEVKINLEDLIINEYDDSVKDLQVINLPQSKKRIELRVQTPRMLDEIALQKKEMKRKTKDSTSRYDYLLTLKSLIKSVDGQVFTPPEMEAFILSMNMRDVNYLLQKADKLNQKVGLDTNVATTCNECGNDLVTQFRITSEFFGPTVD